MDPMPTLAQTTSGDNTTAHVTAAAALATALSEILSWVLTSVAHVVVPDPIQLAFTGVLTFVVSVAMQKLSK